MNKTIKYCVVAAAVAAAAALCGCKSTDEEVLPIERVQDDITPVINSVNGRDTQDTQDDGVATAARSGADDLIKVYVCGAVKYPDVYTVSSDSRTVDAVSAAGGFLPDAGLDYINLAASVSDGQKIYIPTKREIEEAVAEGADIYSAVVNITSNTPGVSGGQTMENSGDTASDLVDINSASKETLMTLPGIGESKADKIIAYREANGRFDSIEDIMLVGGIKEGLYNKVKDRICAR
ncbi:MAG: helix-hairpin-helix domain-containing protein [Lachnospiraceae bacterium]|nr:helix-hairpin-helix domain-containing protein [Lachnospiraceae bacterium]